MFERILDLFEPKAAKTELPPAEANFALGALLVRTARADSSYLFEEIEEIDHVLARLNGLNPVEAAKMRAQCELLEKEMPKTRDLAGILCASISEAEREATVAALWAVVYSDGRRHENEDALVTRVQALLGVDEETCRRLKAQEKAAHPPPGA